MNDSIWKLIEEANRYRELKDQLLGPSVSIARQMEKLRLPDAVLGASTIAAAMEKVGIAHQLSSIDRHTGIAGERISELTAGVGGVDSAFVKTLAAISRPVFDGPTLRALEHTRTSIYERLNIPEGPELQKLHERMSLGAIAQLNASSSAFTSSLTDITASIAEKIGATSPIGSLPSTLPQTQTLLEGMSSIANAFKSVDWMEFEKRMAKVEEGEKALAEAGYEFAAERWTIAFLVELAEMEPATREQAIDEALIRYTTEPDFASELMRYVNGASRLRQRSRLIERALRAHHEGEYFVSIPLFLPQIEGVVSDPLLLSKRAYAQNGKLYKLDLSGNPELDRNGRPKEFTGLHSKAGSLDRTLCDEMQPVAEHLTDKVAPERNPILHGTDVAYDSARRSTQAALVLFILCNIAHDCEKASGN